MDGRCSIPDERIGRQIAEEGGVDFATAAAGCLRFGCRLLRGETVIASEPPLFWQLSAGKIVLWRFTLSLGAGKH